MRVVRDGLQNGQTLCRDLHTELAEHRGIVDFGAHQPSAL
jgi:hypothetical protein